MLRKYSIKRGTNIFSQRSHTLMALYVTPVSKQTSDLKFKWESLTVSTEHDQKAFWYRM